MPLPGSNRWGNASSNKEFLQEIVEPEVSTPVEPEVLVEDAPAPAKKKKSAPKIGGKIKKAVNKAKTTITSKK